MLFKAFHWYNRIPFFFSTNESFIRNSFPKNILKKINMSTVSNITAKTSTMGNMHKININILTLINDSISFDPCCWSLKDEKEILNSVKWKVLLKAWLIKESSSPTLQQILQSKKKSAESQLGKTRFSRDYQIVTACILLAQ